MNYKNIYPSNNFSTNKFDSWEHAAKNTVNYLFRMHDFYLNYPFKKHLDYLDNNISNIENLRLIINYYIKSDLYIDKKNIPQHKELWIAVSFNAIEGIKNYFKEKINIQYITDTLIKKQKDYGHNNIAMFGITGLVIRVHDKIARAENILGKKDMVNAVSEESLQDTFVDMIGYSTIAMMWLEETFMLPLEDNL
jgi:hypothetical protein